MLNLEVAKSKNIVIASIACNVAKSFEKDFNRILCAFSDFNVIKWIVVESNSKDDSLSKLKELAKVNSLLQVINLESDPGDFIRTKHLSDARNMYLQALNIIETSISVDYLVVCDLNNLNKNLSKKSVKTCWDNDNWAVVSANQSSYYYDIYALRHKYWNNLDCWEQYKKLSDLYRQKAPYIWDSALWNAVYSKMIKIPPSTEWIKVDSAFGGLAIYKVEYIRNARYEGVTGTGQQICEHIKFHENILSNGGNIYINPSLINFKYTNHNRRRKYFVVYNSWFYIARILRKIADR
jgi:hypothetical protein